MERSGIRIQMELQITAKKDFIEVYGEIISYNGNLQMNIKRLRVADEGEYDPADYMPTSEKSVDGMYEELMRYGKQVKNPYLAAGDPVLFCK